MARMSEGPSRVRPASVPASAPMVASCRRSSVRCHRSSPAHLGQALDRVEQPGQPVRQALLAGEPVGARTQPVDELREATGQFDLRRSDVVEREGETHPVAVLLGHRHPEQDPVDPGPPGVLRQTLEAEVRAVLGVDRPPDAGLAHPVGDRLQVRVGESEPPAHRRKGGQVEDLGCGGPAPGEIRQPQRRGQQRIRLTQRPIGQPDPQPVRRVTVADHLGQAESGGDQRCVLLDVRTHHQDVPGLQGPVLLRADRQSPRGAPPPAGTGPWQACTWTLRSSVATGASVGGRFAAMSACRRSSSVVAGRTGSMGWSR